MRKILAFVASTAISLGAWSVASANGTVKTEGSKPVPHKQHHTLHHVKPHCPPVCPPCPTLHTGFFGGFDGGYIWGSGKVKHTGQNTGTTGRTTGGHNSKIGFDGGLLGLFIGYDHYFCHQWVLGVEGGAHWSNTAGRTTGFANTNGGTTSRFFRTRLKTDWTYDIALRLGHKVYDCAMWYIKAGAQFTQFKLKSYNSVSTLGVSRELFSNKHRFRSGLLGGLGVEVPVACHWSLGAEYNFTYYQRVSTSRKATNNTNDFLKSRIRPYHSSLLARVIWKQ